MRFLIVGAGAIGCLVGGKLAQSGQDVTLVGRANLAMDLLQRDAEGDRAAAQGLLLQALQAAAEMQLPEAGQILGIMDHYGLIPEELQRALRGSEET